MHRRPSLLFMLAAAAAIGWVLYQVSSDRPASYVGASAPADAGDQAYDREEDVRTDFGPERRERLDSALRQKAARF
jgi:hypothetical protein